jgi:hypothetical protein
LNTKSRALKSGYRGTLDFYDSHNAIKWDYVFNKLSSSTGFSPLHFDGVDLFSESLRDALAEAA